MADGDSEIFDRMRRGRRTRRDRLRIEEADPHTLDGFARPASRSDLTSEARGSLPVTGQAPEVAARRRIEHEWRNDITTGYAITTSSVAVTSISVVIPDWAVEGHAEVVSQVSAANGSGSLDRAFLAVQSAILGEIFADVPDGQAGAMSLGHDLHFTSSEGTETTETVDTLLRSQSSNWVNGSTIITRARILYRGPEP